MKRRHVLLINTIFIGLMIFSAGIVYQFMTGVQVIKAVGGIFYNKKPATVVTDQCSTKKAINMQGAVSPALKRLDTFQEACHSFATDTMMVFVSMPTTSEQAIDYAKQDAKTLKDFARYGVHPLVIAEPTDKNGNKIDFSLAADNVYKPATDTYFIQLKNEGITSGQLGIWTPYPEANLPYWQNNKPEYFAPAVNSYIASLHAVYPDASTSVMLNSATYDTEDFNWENGEYNSLLPYVKGIAPGTVTFAGLQGFPWMARAGGQGSILNAAEFLNPDLLTEMATSLGTKKVWFNTGTFSTKYTQSSDAEISVTPERRKAILTTITNQTTALQKQGYDVAVNIFAQDKSNTSEETNWSYWQQDPFSSIHSPVITQFIGGLNQKHVKFWLFDR